MSEPAPPGPADPTGPAGQVPTCYRHPGREAYIHCQRCDRVICPDCMRDSAVGFQCPSCVAEGAKSTRSGRTAYGGLRPSNPMLTSVVLIGINAVVWLLITATGGARSILGDRLVLLPTGRCLVTDRPDQYYPSVTSADLCHTVGGTTWINGVADGAYWQLVTSTFAHTEIWHIGFNMLALWVLGPQLEVAVGRVRFLALYLLSGLAGSALVYWLAPPTGATLGASGAIFGLMGALLVVVYKVGGNTQQILMWIGINFLITVVGRGFISWQGHLGGFVGGVVIAAIIAYAPRANRATVQVAGLSAVGVLLLVAVVARTVVLTS